MVKPSKLPERKQLVHTIQQIEPIRRPAVIEVIEAQREEEFVSTDRYRLDNAGSSATISRVKAISKQWSRTFTTSAENARVINGMGRVNFVVDISSKVEDALRRKYEVVGNTQLKVDESITVNIPPGKKVILEIQWKVVWARGIIRVKDEKTRVEADLPFRYSVELTFDHKTWDEE